MRRRRVIILTVLAAFLLAALPARAEVAHAAEFLVFLNAGKGDARTGTMDIGGCEPGKVRVTVVRDRRTHEVVAGGIDTPIRWKSPAGLTVQMRSSSFDPTLNVFYGGALLSGGGLPGPARVRTLCFNARGIVSMRGIELEREWLLGDIAFCPTECSWGKQGFHFQGTLAVQRQPKVEVTLHTGAITMRGPLTPWFSLTGDRMLNVERFELLRGRIVASGSYYGAEGRLVMFTRRPLKANADIDLALPRPAPKPAPKPEGKTTPSSQRAPTAPAGEASAMESLHDDGGVPIGSAPQAVVVPSYSLLHVLTALVLEAARGEGAARASGFVPEWLAQADPLQAATATFDGPGLSKLDVAGPAVASRVPSRMTAASPWTERTGKVVPTGYVTLGPPAFRVYYKNAPVDASGRAMLDDQSTKLYWQTRWVSSKVYFPGGGTNRLELRDNVKWEQQEGFWTPRGNDELRVDEKGNIVPASLVKPYFFTSAYSGSWSGPGWLSDFLGQDAVHDRVQANPSEFGQWFEVGLKKPWTFFKAGNAHLALTFAETNEKLYYALLNPQQETPQSGLLFRIGGHLPGLAVYYDDGSSEPFEFTRAEKRQAAALVRYTSSGFFHVLLDVKRVPLLVMMKGLVKISDPYINIHGQSGTTQNLRKNLSGTIGFGIKVTQFFKGTGRFNLYYNSDSSWGLAGTTNFNLKIWKFSLNLTKQRTFLDFGAKQFFVQIDTPAINLFIFKAENLSLRFQLSREAINLIPNGQHTEDNYTFALTFNAKALKKIPLSFAIVAWSDNHWELWRGTQRLPPVQDVQKDIEYRDPFTMYGLTLNGTYHLLRSNDGETVEQSVWTDSISFQGRPTHGGSLQVRDFQVPQPTSHLKTGNLDPSSGRLLSGTKVKTSLAFDVPQGDGSIRASDVKAELTINPDGTASSQESEVYCTVKEKNEAGVSEEVNRKLKVQVVMRDGPTGGGVMTVIVISDDGTRVPYDFTCMNK